MTNRQPPQNSFIPVSVLESEIFEKIWYPSQTFSESRKRSEFLNPFFQIRTPTPICLRIRGWPNFMMVTPRGSSSSQVWLTYVLTDLDVSKALTLCNSMKRVFTSRKLAVFVSRNVSPSMREVVRSAFDFFFYLEDELNTAGLKNEEFVKLSAFTLKCFGKLVFLEPTMFDVKNSDDIFDNYEVPSGLLATEVCPGDIDDG
ncbi:unnamed protein product [Orchesella dallaii]|uniref:Uncharacterized protein n=1 Tax=Orchesella dallaii TaxID=48710 RepID=A0ABP1S5G7_9HEXA